MLSDLQKRIRTSRLHSLYRIHHKPYNITTIREFLRETLQWRSCFWSASFQTQNQPSPCGCFFGFHIVDFYQLCVAATVFDRQSRWFAKAALWKRNTHAWPARFCGQPVFSHFFTANFLIFKSFSFFGELNRSEPPAHSDDTVPYPRLSSWIFPEWPNLAGGTAY